MNALIHELDIFKELVESFIFQNIKPQHKCRFKLSDGKRCSFNATCNDGKTCKKHEKNINSIKIKKEVLYHNHMPFEIGINCALCEKIT
jgi:hypothetical protein